MNLFLFLVKESRGTKSTSLETLKRVPRRTKDTDASHSYEGDRGSLVIISKAKGKKLLQISKEAKGMKTAFESAFISEPDVTEVSENCIMNIIIVNSCWCS